MAYCIPIRFTQGLLLAVATLLLNQERQSAADSAVAVAAAEFSLFEQPLDELARPDAQLILIDLELAIRDLARLNREEDCEHLLRVAGALRWQIATTDQGGVGPDLTQATRKLEVLAWSACALRALGRAQDGEIVGWALRAGLMDLAGRDDPESHWIRGQSPSWAELVELCGNLGAAARGPMGVAAMSAFHEFVFGQAFSRTPKPAIDPAQETEVLRRQIQEAALLLGKLRVDLARLRFEER